MDKKILFKRIASTVSAVVVFALSFFSFGLKSEVATASVNSVGGALNDDNLILSPFANLSFSGYSNYEQMLAYYSIRYDFPRTITSYYDSGHPYGGSYSGNLLNIYDYERQEYMFYFFDYISESARALYFHFTPPTSTNFVLSGSSFFIPQRYFDLLFSTSFSGISSHGMQFWVDNPQSGANYSASFVIKMIVKDNRGVSYDLFGEDGVPFYISGTTPFSLAQAYSYSDDLAFSSYFSILGYMADTFHYYSDDDVYYFIEDFSMDFSFGSLVPFTFRFGLSSDVLETYRLIDNNDVSLLSYKSVSFLNTISSDYFEDSVSNSFQRGKDLGYSIGFAEGSSQAYGDFDIFGTIVSAIADFLSFEILPNFTLGTLFLISFGAAFLFFVIKMFLGG